MVPFPEDRRLDLLLRGGAVIVLQDAAEPLSAREGSDLEPLDRTSLVQSFALHGQIQVAVVLNRIAVRVEQGRVPVA